MNTLQKMGLACTVLLLAACGGVQKAQENYDMSVAKEAIGKPFAAAMAETRSNFSEATNPWDMFQKKATKYGKKVATESLTNGYKIEKTIDRTKSSQMSFLGGIVSKDQYRYMIYFFKVNPSGQVEDVASTTYNADNTWSLNTVFNIVPSSEIVSVQSAAIQKDLAEVEPLLKTASGQTLKQWRK